jgi:hypothetical protein
MPNYTAPERMLDAPVQLGVFTYGQDTVAASQTDVNLPRAIGEASQAVATFVAPFAGCVVAMGATFSATGTAGEITIGVTKNGTEAAATTQTLAAAVTMSEGYATFARTAMPFAAGDNIGVQITTDASWDATSADLSVDVYVLFEVVGV